jgi:hypothetical protein
MQYSLMAIYERIKAWERCHELCVAVYNVTNTWPTAERYGLTSQARRAAHSAAANIAELARDLKILAQDQWLQLNELQGKAGGMTWLLYRSMLERKATAPHTQ